MKSVGGMLRPGKGSILFEGEDVTGRKPFQLVRRGICYVPTTGGSLPTSRRRQSRHRLPEDPRMDGRGCTTCSRAPEISGRRAGC